MFFTCFGQENNVSRNFHAAHDSNNRLPQSRLPLDPKDVRIPARAEDSFRERLPKEPKPRHPDLKRDPGEAPASPPLKNSSKEIGSPR